MKAKLLMLLPLFTCASIALGSDLRVDMSQGNPPSGNKLNGPLHITLQRINKLLSVYTVTVQNQNWTANPAVTLSNIQNLPPSPSTPAPSKSHGDDAAIKTLQQVQLTLTQAHNAAYNLDAALDKIQPLYLRSSGDLSVSTDALVKDIQQTLANSDVEHAEAVSWPHPDAINDEVSDLQQEKATGGLSSDIAQQVNDALAALQKVEEGAISEKSYSDALAAFHQAVNTMNALAPNGCKPPDANGFVQGRDTPCDSFELTQDIQCHGVFGGNDAALTLHVSPAISFPGAPNQTAQTFDLGTMTCSAPIAFSAGVAFSSINENDFAINQVTTSSGGTSTTSNEFQLASQGSFTPLPMGFAHARLWETPEALISVHATVGVGAHIRSQSSGGSDPEYVVGGSISLWHVIYFTGGVDFGSSVTLADGYTVGSAVPSSVTQPPLQVNRAVGTAFAISFSTTPK